MRLRKNGRLPLAGGPDLLSGSPHPSMRISEFCDALPGPADSCDAVGASGAVQRWRSPSRSDAAGALDGDERPNPDQQSAPAPSALIGLLLPWPAPGIGYESRKSANE